MDPADDGFIEVARIGQAHGLDGVVKIYPNEFLKADFRTGALFYLKNRRGDLFPARIEKIRTEEKRNQTLFFVKFDRIASRTEAEPFRDTPIYSDQTADLEQSQYEMVLGYHVHDESGTIGSITAVILNPAHPILEVETSGQTLPRRLLIPWVEVYVQSVDHEQRVVYCHQLDPLKSL